MSGKLSSLAGYDSPSDDEENPEKKSPTAIDNISGSDDEDTRDSFPGVTKDRGDGKDIGGEPKRKSDDVSPSSPGPAKKVSRLVSYYGDELEDDDDENTSKDEQSLPSALLNVGDYGDSFASDLAASMSVNQKDSDVENGLQLPPEPPGKCSKHLQDKIAAFYNKRKDLGLDLNSSIQRRKDFRNPSIYEKLIEFCNIDEKGTNYPAEMYDPHCWGKSSYYDELAKAQKAEMDKREKERKDRTKVEFVTGTAKKSDIAEVEKRKTKWDSAPKSGVAKQPIVPPPTVVTATGSKNQISALGSISKKK